MKLDDATIRKHLIDKVASYQPVGVAEEVRVGNGRAIADVVGLFQEPHCYEIKGETDKVPRILDQDSYFSRAFRKVTLVTTPNHARIALRIAPNHWGIMIAQADAAGIKFTYSRGATSSPDFDPNFALLTLWKKELLDLVNDKKSAPKKHSRATLARIVSSSTSNELLLKNISTALLTRINQGLESP